MAKPALSAVIGLGLSPMSRRPIGTTRDLARIAVERAVADAGLAPREIDGLLVARSPLVEPDQIPLHLQNDLQLRDLRLLSAIDGEGSSTMQMLHYATMAIRQRLARNVVCVFADTPVGAAGKGGDSFAVAMGLTGIDGWEARQGLIGAAAAYGLAARRHMTAFGTTERHLGAWAIAARAWAERSPQALLRKPLTMEDYLASPMVVEPFRMLDCAYPVNGAVAFVVTAARPSLERRRAAFVHGIAQGHRGRGLLGDPEFETGASLAAERLYAGLGITGRDVTSAQVYEAFSYVGLLALEEYGLTPRGEAGPAVAAGLTAPGGRLPVNTGGGHLSGWYLQGATPMAEAVTQIFGRGETRQIAETDLTLVTGVGGCLDFHAAAILSPHARL
jgi:acetyl-CoA acetyltransferase